MTSKVVRELEHVPYGERLQEWGMFSQKRKLQGDQVSDCQYLQEDLEEDGAEHSVVRQEDKTQWP